jgi:hypothetical protein
MESANKVRTRTEGISQYKSSQPKGAASGVRERGSVHGVLACVFWVTLWVLMAVTTKAAPVVFTGTSGNLSASVTYEQGGSNFVMTLCNTSTYDVLVPGEVLTGVFFTLAGDPKLQPISAIVSPGSTVLFGSTDPGGVVGGEWAYSNGLTGAPFGVNSGISSSGLGLFGPHNLFPGSNLQGPRSPGGLEYGLTSAGDNRAIGNTPVTGKNALIKNSVVFTLRLPENYAFTEDSISAVSFQYGTSLSERNVRGVKIIPEPSTVILVGVGLMGLLAFSRRKRA